jgi:hypothetical protein
MYMQDFPASSGDVDLDGERKLLLQALRIAHQQFKIALNVIDTIGVGLKAGLIDPDIALEWLRDEALIDYVSLEPPGSEREAA